MKTVSTIIGDFTKPDYDDLVLKYKKAVAAEEKTFVIRMYGSKEIVTSFAKYLIEFLEPHFKDMM